MAEHKESRHSERLINFISSICDSLEIGRTIVLLGLCYLVWGLTSNILVNVLIVSIGERIDVNSFTTTLPIQLIQVVTEIFSSTAIKIRKIHASPLSNALCDWVKFLTASAFVLHGRIIHGE